MLYFVTAGSPATYSAVSNECLPFQLSVPPPIVYCKDVCKHNELFHCCVFSVPVQKLTLGIRLHIVDVPLVFEDILRSSRNCL